jgi:YtkA-like
MRWWPMLGLLASGGALACGDALGTDARRIDSAQFQLAYRLLPDPVPVGQHFVIDVVLCPKANATLPAEVRVDATMPEHKHGMNYRPSVKTLAPGQYRAEGLMFHMPGRWELVFELRGSGAPVRLSQSLQVG